MAEKEYIERGALLKSLRAYYGCSIECDKDCPVTECGEGRIVMTAPAADVVEVVRCKDCKHGQRNNSGQLRGRYICEYHQDYAPLFSPYHFCSNGERREQT